MEQIEQIINKYTKKARLLKTLSHLFLGLFLMGIFFYPVSLLIPVLHFHNVYLVHFTVLVIFVFIAVISSMLHTFWLNQKFDVIPIYKYMTEVLQTKISIDDAKYLSPLFDPSYINSNTWVTMQNIIALPIEMRRKAALDAAQKIYEERKKVKK